MNLISFCRPQADIWPQSKITVSGLTRTATRGALCLAGSDFCWPVRCTGLASSCPQAKCNAFHVEPMPRLDLWPPPPSNPGRMISNSSFGLRRERENESNCVCITVRCLRLPGLTHTHTHTHSHTVEQLVVCAFMASKLWPHFTNKNITTMLSSSSSFATISGLAKKDAINFSKGTTSSDSDNVLQIRFRLRFSATLPTTHASRLRRKVSETEIGKGLRPAKRAQRESEIKMC